MATEKIKGPIAKLIKHNPLLNQIVRNINELIDGNVTDDAAVVLNTAHRDDETGADHADLVTAIGLNTTHKTSAGADHANIGTNTTAISSILNGTTGFTGAIRNVGEAGASPVGTCIATEFGTGRDFITVLTLTNFIIGAPNPGANLSIGNLIYTFPVGAHLHEITLLQAGMVLTAAGNAQAALDLGIGSKQGTAVQATLAADDNDCVDYVAGQTEASGIAGGLACAEALVGATAAIHTDISINGAAGTKTVFLNAAAAWHASITGNLTATGVIVLKWSFLN
jgi:hypothetical protein